MARLFDVDVMVYVFAGVGAIAVVLLHLALLHDRWQRDTDADPPGMTSDPGD